MKPPWKILLCCATVVLGSLLAPLSAAAFYDNGFDSAPGAFLVSADSGYVTGQRLVVDGGGPDPSIL